MFQPLALFVGLRYLFSSRSNKFISFIGIVSISGIALGVMVLITVLSVMNGFDKAMHDNFFKVVNHITISGIDGNLANWKKLEEKIVTNPNIAGTSPFIQGEAMLAYDAQSQPVAVFGILPNKEKTTALLNEHMLKGNIDTLKKDQSGIIIGKTLAEKLGLSVGDNLGLITLPRQQFENPTQIVPQLNTFEVVGIFDLGNSFKYNSNVVFIHLDVAQKVFDLPNLVTALKIKVKNLYDAPQIGQQLASILSAEYQIIDWTQTSKGLFEVMKLIKTLVFLMLVLLIATAAFCLLSTLTMTVAAKKGDIAILRTFGITPKGVVSIFLVQGAMIGVLGTFIGIVTGVILSIYIGDLTTLIENFFQIQLVSKNTYMVDQLPSELAWSDVALVGTISLVLSILATIYPALKAARQNPAEALRYE